MPHIALPDGLPGITSVRPETAAPTRVREGYIRAVETAAAPVGARPVVAG
jgi:hypothetical protein